ncbi:MAG: hypothetical protein AAB320_07870 [Elusimicrobiota bacterium]
MLKRFLVGLLCLAGTPAAQAALSRNAEIQLDEGLKHLYGMDYDKSRAAFRKLIELEPDNPFGYLFESGAIWWQSSQEYGLFKDTPTLQGLFEQDVDAAVRKADPLTDAKDKTTRADGHFVEGMSLGTRGQWGLLRGHYWRAFLDGKKAIKHLKKCVKIDEDYYDAQLGLGIFDYQAARMGGVLKLSFLVGVHGDEERGLAKIREAMDHGRFGARQAAQFLSSIYIIDRHDYARALPIIERLRRDFPDSPYFQLIDVYLHYRLGDWDSSLKEARLLFDKVKADPRAYNRKMLGLYCGLAGERCLEQGDMERALVWLHHAVESSPLKPKEKPGPWHSMLYLYRGQVLDLLGQPEEAAKDYKRVLAQPDFSDYHARAHECMKATCTAENTLQYLRTLSKDEAWRYGKD